MKLIATHSKWKILIGFLFVGIIVTALTIGLKFKKVPVKIFGTSINLIVPKGQAKWINSSEKRLEKQNLQENLLRMNEFIRDNITYPKEALKAGAQGIVHVQFVVTEKGEIEQVKVVRSVHQLLDEESVRIVKLCPQWTPITIDGKPISESITIPILFLPICAFNREI